MTIDSTKAIRQALIEVDAETRHAEAVLHDMRTKGSDHFKARHQEELQTLTDEGLDDWSSAEWARRQVEEKAAY